MTIIDKPCVLRLGLFFAIPILLIYVVAAPCAVATPNAWKCQVPVGADLWWKGNRWWAWLLVLVVAAMPVTLPRIYFGLSSVFILVSICLTLTTRNSIFILLAAGNLVLSAIFLEAWHEWFWEKWKAAQRFTMAGGQNPVPRHGQVAQSASVAVVQVEREQAVYVPPPAPAAIGLLEPTVQVERFGLQLRAVCLSAAEVAVAGYDANALQGRSVFLDCPSQTPTLEMELQRISERLSRLGMLVRGSDLRAEAYVWIQSASDSRQRAFAVVLQLKPGIATAYACTADILCDALPRSLAHAFQEATQK